MATSHLYKTCIRKDTKYFVKFFRKQVFAVKIKENLSSQRKLVGDPPCLHEFEKHLAEQHHRIGTLEINTVTDAIEEAMKCQETRHFKLLYHSVRFKGCHDSWFTWLDLKVRCAFCCVVIRGIAIGRETRWREVMCDVGSVSCLVSRMFCFYLRYISIYLLLISFILRWLWAMRYLYIIDDRYWIGDWR